MNEGNRKCQNKTEHDTTTNSSSILNAILSSYGLLETKSHEVQCCVQSDDKPKSKYSWRRLLSYLPSWLRSTSPATPICDIEKAEASKPNPAIRICNAKPYTSHESGRHAGQEKLEKKCLKKPSYERILSSFNFDEMAPEQSGCEYFTPKELKPCGKHSSSTEYNEKKTSTHKGSKPRNSCACPSNTDEQAQKTPITMTTTPHCCNEPSTNSRCRESLFERVWAYLQALITSHRSDCERCNQMRSNDSMNARPSNNSNVCKQSLLEQALSYLRKITIDHVEGCARCQQKPSGCNSNETTSYLQTMLEQAWSYIKKLGSDDPQSCCPRCKQSGRRVCCKHSTTREQYPTRETCVTREPCVAREPCVTRETCPTREPCVTREPCMKREPCRPREPCPTRQPNQGILKYPSSSNCRCYSRHSIIKEFPKKQPCPTENVKRSCPKTCEGKPPQPLKPLPRLCRSEEERTFDKDSPYIPYCKQPSRHSRLQIYSGSHDKSCCLSQFDMEKPECTVTKQKSSGSIILPLDLCKSINASKKNCSVESIISQEIMEYHSSAKCAGPCGKSNSHSAPKQGISLSQEPNDHRFCTRPNECKHSKQSLDQPKCNDTCLAPCKKTPDEEEQAKNVCVGGCAKCNNTYSSTTQLYQEERMVDTKYEAYLDKKYGDIVKVLLDKETICEDGCCCVTCIQQVQIPDEGSKADPHKYRYYW